MSVRGRIGRLRAVALLVALVLAGLTGSRVPAQAQADPWQLVGPVRPGWESSAPRPVVGSGWPHDQTIVAGSSHWLIRSDDGGSTWTYLPVPSNGPAGAWIASDADRQAVLLTTRGAQATGGEPTLQRSVDRGASWSPVLVLGGSDREGTMEIIVPPDLPGTIFVKTARRLHRSEDGGATWTTLDLGLADQQLLSLVRLSPSYAHDRTVFVTATTASVSFPVQQPPNNDPSASPLLPDEHATSAGVLVSRDGGETWQQAVAGLEADGQPYRYVRDLVVSPTFAQDHTLFAWGWGPAEVVPVASEQRLVFANALFRSRDAGVSWERIWDRPTRVTDTWGPRLLLAPSPSFAEDGIVLAAAYRSVALRNPSQLAPDARVSLADLDDRCDWYRSADAGTTWSTTSPVLISSRRSCFDLRYVATTEGRRALTAAGFGPNGGWLESRDDGLTWQPLGTPPGQRSGAMSLLGIDPVGPLLFVGSDGLWLYGGPPVPPPSPPACPVPPDQVFASYLVVPPGAQVDYQLGCPTEPARAVRYQQRRLAAVLGLWPEDAAVPAWLLLRIGSTSSNWSSGAWETRSKAADPWPGPPDETIEVLEQPFWFGRLLVRTDPSGEQHVIRLAEPTLSQPTRAWTEAPLDRSRR